MRKSKGGVFEFKAPRWMTKTQKIWKNGVGFVRLGNEKFEPKINLSEIGLKISTFIENEKYQGASISVGESLPLIWVNGEDNFEPQKILHRSLGTVSVMAYPREEFCTAWIAQNLLLRLIECENKTDWVIWCF